MLDDPNKKMCLVQYSSIEESLNAVAFLHGYSIYGRFEKKKKKIFFFFFFVLKKMNLFIKEKYKYLSQNRKFDIEVYIENVMLNIFQKNCLYLFCFFF